MDPTFRSQIDQLKKTITYGISCYLVISSIVGISFLTTCSIQETSPAPVNQKYTGLSNTQRSMSDSITDATTQQPNPGIQESAPAKFVPYDTPPEPIGGYSQIQLNLVYPEAARDTGIKGTVRVQCYIFANGQVGECRILSGLPGYGFNEAAINAIITTQWRPAEQSGKPVPVWISIPVVFRPGNTP